MTDDADVLATARAAVETGPLCDPCLGRLVADRSFGLTNRERGRGLRVALALADDVPVADLEPDEPCWVCEGHSTEARVREWAERAAYHLEEYAFDTFQVGTRVPAFFAENGRLLREDVGLDPDAGEQLKSELNREVGKRFGAETGAEVDFERPDVQVTLNLGEDAVETRIDSAFVYGRYRKLERDIPQTKWPCNDCSGTGLVRGEVCAGCGGSGYRYDESVEQLTAPVVREAMDGESATFHGAGREDVDARMLEGGRPFVVEVDEPRVRNVDTDALEADVAAFADGKVEVFDLHLATHDAVERVKELDASKTYRTAVAFDEPVDAEGFQAALDELRGETDGSARIEGPLSPDTLFARYRHEEQPYDGIVCMYHDQGLIPLKLQHFGESANVTLGLPIIRTSVDHGTAYDIAGEGAADSGSMRYAIELAAAMVRRDE